MSDFGAATDQTKNDARAKSRHCPHCGGEGMAEVFDPGYDGRRVLWREAIAYGEIKRVLYPQVIAAHCVCPMGRWIRSKTDADYLDRIPDMADVLAGRSRYQAADPNGDEPGAWFQRQESRGGVLPVGQGR